MEKHPGSTHLQHNGKLGTLRQASLRTDDAQIKCGNSGSDDNAATIRWLKCLCAGWRKNLIIHAKNRLDQISLRMVPTI